VFTGEGKLARRATGYEREKAEAALSHIGVRGLRKPSFRRPLERIGDPQISPTRLRKRHANKIAEFRKLAYQFHEQGTALCVNRILTRLSVPKSREHRIARGLLAEIKREIPANGRPGGGSPASVT